MAREPLSFSNEKRSHMSDAPQKQNFPFPFTPYKSQQLLMEQIFQTIEEKKIAIFESPTGTGKSLSIICSVLHWLLDYHGKHPDKDSSDSSDGQPSTSTSQEKNPQWVQEFIQREKADEAKAKKGQVLEVKKRVNFMQESYDKLQKNSFRGLEAMPKRKRGEGAENSDEAASGDENEAELKREEEDSDLLLDWNEEAPENPMWKTLARAANEHEAPEDLEQSVWAQELMERLGMTKSKPKKFNNQDDEVTPKIIYCSRTHSQLSQFIHEIKKTEFRDRVRCVSLGARKNLCINPDVKKLKSATKMADKCLDLKNQKKSKKTVGSKRSKRAAGCPFLQDEGQTIFKDWVLAQPPRDLENLHQLGQSLGTCAYYGARVASGAADVVCIPYPSLVHKATRESLGLKIKDNIVIIDEAHNLLDTINDTHSITVSASKLAHAHAQLSDYFERYKTRLSSANSQRIRQLLTVVHKLGRFLTHPALKSRPSASSDAGNPLESREIKSINDFLFDVDIDNINFFKLVEFILKSDLCKKLNGFALRYLFTASSGEASSPQKQPSSGGGVAAAVAAGVMKNISPLVVITEFLSSLNNCSEDGRMVITRVRAPKSTSSSEPTGSGTFVPFQSSSSVMFLMMNPSISFREVVDEARSVILAGGTMKPFHFLTSQIFSHIPPERLHMASFNHVVPPENVLALSLSSGPSKKRFNFTMQRRKDLSQIQELGELVFNMCKIVPGGVICFFCSYDFEDFVLREWERKSVTHRIRTKKTVFREPRDSDQLETVWNSYSRCVAKENGKGALLTCVIGGKMSEGINFSDDLARCVILVGLPYPNPHDPVLKEKVRYQDSLSSSKGSAGKVYYRNLCMRAVNQSIGRSIRHVTDYACTLLVDERYSNQEVANALPDWIKARLAQPASFGGGFKLVRQFFASKLRKSTVS